MCAETPIPTAVARVFQNHCLGCHNDMDRKGGYSLQSRAAALVGDFIIKRDANSSPLMDLIQPHDGKAEMPKDRDPLSASEVEAVRNWINDGAPWPTDHELKEPVVDQFDWWSYQPIRRPDVPKFGETQKHPIDAFIQAKLKEQGLKPSARTDRRTLIRRLTFDLTGLPPTPTAVNRFVQSSDPGAYEKLVDDLLASKHYGERWARHWLDVVKYADTCGYDKDKLRPNAWPYRDYVIRSFNEDKPYSRFVQEQIAGDALFPGDPEGVVALGFIAAGPWDHIGHVEVPESKMDGMVARNLDRDDMVSNAMNTFCSLTVQCARCHNHKFDPITQEHYYGLQSIFAAVDRAERPYDLDPQIEQERRDLENRIAKLQNELRNVENEIDREGGKPIKQLSDEIKTLNSKLSVSKTPAFGYHSQFASTPVTEKWVEIDLGSEQSITSISLHPSHDDFGGIGAGFGFPVRFRVEVASRPESENRTWRYLGGESDQDFPNPGLAVYEIDGLDLHARYLRVTATQLFHRKDKYIFSLAEVQVKGPDQQNLARNARVTAFDSIEASPRWARGNLVDGQWAKWSDAETGERVTRLKSKLATLTKRFESTPMAKKRSSLNKQLEKLRKKTRSLPTGKMVYAAATHFKPRGNFKPTGGQLRPIRVLHRGNINQPGQIASACTIPLHKEDSKFQFTETDNESQRRDQFARWLTNKENPFVWRSIVNRVWQYHFGTGIVATPNDFGRMGMSPTHPALLDWLASEFRDGEQSLKSLHRLIVTSETYKQRSRVDSNQAKVNRDRDASNRFLWRMNRRRLSAEEIRDSILSVSGMLNPKMGGPGYYLFQLEHTQHSPHYEYHKFDPADESSHRRSIYRFIVRSQPDPWMTALDCADSSQSTPRRNETLTSLQALSMLNNRFNLFMAQKFADHLATVSDSMDEQIKAAMRLVAQRDPTQTELVEVRQYAKLHGMPNLCRVLFNLSEFVYID